MPGESGNVRDDLLGIWRAGVDAVDGKRVVRQHVQVQDNQIRFVSGDTRHIVSFPLDEIDRICVVGGGKAASGMALGFESALGPRVLQSKKIRGWINIPAGTQLPTQSIHLHVARPSGVNEPTEEAVKGTARMLEMVACMGPRDLCVVLLSGGGSALMPAPCPPVSLADKLTVTRMLSAAGADIHQLNTVRKQLSQIKGGKLARACRARSMVTLLISDVLGDPLDVIGSGPTVENPTTAREARDILTQFMQDRSDVPESIWTLLNAAIDGTLDGGTENTINGAADQTSTSQPATRAEVHNLVIGNIDVALAACRDEAKRRGFHVEVAATDWHEPTAEEVAARVVEKSSQLLVSQRPTCWISGGEPTVHLAPPSVRGQGGRNQQLVLAVMEHWLGQAGCSDSSETPFSHPPTQGRLAFLSGGTDGEDGPTDAAGGMIWPDVLQSLAYARLDVHSHLIRNDAYHLLGPLGCLVRTGPTHTNVCDIRILIVR